MRTLLFLTTLLFSNSIFAQSDWSIRLREVNDRQTAALHSYRAQNQTWDDPRRPEHTTFFVDWQRETLEQQLEALEGCSNCQSMRDQLQREAEQQIAYQQLQVAGDIAARNAFCNQQGISCDELNNKFRQLGTQRTGSATITTPVVTNRTVTSVNDNADVVVSNTTVVPDTIVLDVTPDRTTTVTTPIFTGSDSTSTAVTVEPDTSEVTATTSVTPDVLTQNDDEEASNYDPDSCEWAEDMPRRLVSGPGCDTEARKLCVGYVVCNMKSGNGKFVRMSTCSARNCRDGKAAAVECTKELPYKSYKPADEDLNYASERVRRMLATPRTTEQ